MAKKKAKKKLSEKNEEWFEDDLEDQVKKRPAKKISRKNKKNKTGTWIFAFIFVLAVLLALRLWYVEAPDEDLAAEELPEFNDLAEDSAPFDIGEQEVFVIEENVTEHSVVDADDILLDTVDVTVNPLLLSNVRCEFDAEEGVAYVSLRLYNTLDKEMMISPRGVSKGYNTYFTVRGLVDQDPGCLTEIVKPGEYTECRRIGFDLGSYVNLEGINRISVQSPGMTEAILVECPSE